MAIRHILTEGDETLNKVSRPVTDFNERLHILLDDMHETLAEANGVGLAAPQVGVLRRACLVDNGEEVLELINPEILETAGEQTGPEGCLSVPDKYAMVTRPNYVKVKAQDRFGVWHEYAGEELTARCFAHEIEHLDGHLYTEKVTKFMTDEEIEAYYNQK